jgi:DNA-binding CsgD family transcriptional regulator
MWFKKYGWKENPFLVRHNINLVALEKEKQRLVDYVNSGTICFVVGDSGVGKTSLLKWIENNMKKFKVNYINAEGLPEFFNLKSKIKKSWFKPALLLVDEGQLCDEAMRSELKLLWDMGVVKSVVIAQTNERLHEYSISFKSRVGKRFLRIQGLDPECAFELIERRTNTKNPFTENIVEMIVEDAKTNPRKILENCEYLCIELQDKEEITENDVKIALKKKREEELFDLIKLDEPKLPDNLTPIENDKLKDFSPMQRKIIRILLEGNRSAKQLASILNSTEGSVGKQLSKLGELKVVITVNHRRPKVYGLEGCFKTELN